MQGRNIRSYFNAAVSYVNGLFRRDEHRIQEERQDDPLIEEAAPQQGAQNDITTSRIIADYAAFIFASENRIRLFAVAMISLLGTGMNFLAPYLLGEVINSLSGANHVTEENTSDEQLLKIAGLVLAYSFIQILPNIRDQIMVPVSVHNTKKLLVKISEKQLSEKSLQYHINTLPSEKIYLVQKSFSVSDVGTPLFTQVTPALLEIMIASFVLARQHGPLIGLGASTTFALYTAYCAVTTKPIIHAREEMLKTGSSAWQAIESSLSHYKSVHDFNKLTQTIAEVEHAVNHAARAEQAAKGIPLKIALGHIAIPRLGTLLASLYVGMRVQGNPLAIREFVTLFGYLNQLSVMIPTVGQAMNQVFSSYPDMKYVFGELAKPTEIVDRYPDVKLLTNGPPVIAFNNVTFGYPDRPLAFNDLSFTIQSGQTVALVSESGAGKSTLFNLLYGYYQPNSGSITINGQDSATVSRQSLQAAIGMVGQAANLHSGTVRDNIKFGASDPDAVNDDSLNYLAEKLNLTEFLRSLNSGLDTNVGQDGKAFSGGQQQKVAILRGFLQHAPIRLLDEITAALDAGSADAVLDGIKRHFLADATTLIITHKLKEVTFADKIIVLDKGRVLAEGTHDALLASCPLYQTLWQKQFDEPSMLTSPPGLLVQSRMRSGLLQVPAATSDLVSESPRLNV